MGPIRALRSLGNVLGLAWWAKVQTKGPEATYWYGPFLTRRSLKSNLSKFSEELLDEGVESISHNLIRGRRDEPLTL